MPDTPVALAWKRLSRRFKTPLRTATGEHAARESLVLRVQLADGRVGFAEAASWPGFPVPPLDAVEQELRSVKWEAGDASATSSETRSRCALTLHTSHFLIRAPLDWARLGWGDTDAARPCAALLLDDADAPARVAAGFTTLKRKIGVGAARDEQRAVAALVRACGDGVKLRLDANGALNARDCAHWCDFLSEFPEVEWLEQPMRVGAEPDMLAAGEKAGVADRLALDESACAADTLPESWPGVLAVKPVLLGDLDAWRARRAAYPQIAYSSAFESPFGRQAALCVAAEDARCGTGVPPVSEATQPCAGRACHAFAVGFDTLGAFDDDLDVHAPGPVAATVARDAAFWDALWNRL